MSVAATITHHDGRTTLRLAGELDFPVRGQLQQICESVADATADHLVVDLSDIGSLDRGSIRLLEGLATDVLVQGASVVFIAPSRAVRLMLAAYGLRPGILVTESRLPCS